MKLRDWIEPLLFVVVVFSFAILVTPFVIAAAVWWFEFVLGPIT
jgi:hypothetical protein